MHIECDEELIKQFGTVKPLQIAEAEDRYSTIFGSWHASIIKALGSQFLLTVHSKSLYSTIDLIEFSDSQLLFQAANNLRGKILEILEEEYYLTDYQEKGITEPFQNITFGLIADKRMALITKGIVLSYQKRFLRARRESPDGEIRLWELEDDLNNTPRRNLGGATPAQILRQLIWSGVN